MPLAPIKARIPLMFETGNVYNKILQPGSNLTDIYCTNLLKYNFVIVYNKKFQIFSSEIFLNNIILFQRQRTRINISGVCRKTRSSIQCLCHLVCAERHTAQSSAVPSGVCRETRSSIECLCHLVCADRHAAQSSAVLSGVCRETQSSVQCLCHLVCSERHAAQSSACAN